MLRHGGKWLLVCLQIPEPNRNLWWFASYPHIMPGCAFQDCTSTWVLFAKYFKHNMLPYPQSRAKTGSALPALQRQRQLRTRFTLALYSSPETSSRQAWLMLFSTQLPQLLCACQSRYKVHISKETEHQWHVSQFLHIWLKIPCLPSQLSDLSLRWCSRKSKKYFFSRLVPSLWRHGGRWSNPGANQSFIVTCPNMIPSCAFQRCQHLSAFCQIFQAQYASPSAECCWDWHLVAHCLPCRESVSWEAQPFPTKPTI